MRPDSRSRSRYLILLALIAWILAGTTGPAADQVSDKLDPLLRVTVTHPIGRSPVVIEGSIGPLLDQLITAAGGTLGLQLPIISARAAEVPDSAILSLAASSLVQHISLDRATGGGLERTAATVGATAVRQTFAYDGRGIGIAVIDSGITGWHDDLSSAANPTTQRVARFVDFVNGGTAPYDDYGHGTHVAGIIAGNGYDSGGARSGMAPASTLSVLKVLDSNGAGRISHLIAALGDVLDNQRALNIRAVNISIGAAVSDSYTKDPLSKATRRVVDAGIVVVAAAGNCGVTSSGEALYGCITSPGNAPWVITVGASSHRGTADRSDDGVAPFSSRGPTYVDRVAKPDLVAPGVGIESLSVPGSELYRTRSAYLLGGSVATSYPPYLSLSGTSMSSPVVTGTVALMLQANPALTPNAVKAILQYTAEWHAEADWLTQGAGFLDAYGAVAVARSFADSNAPYSPSASWSDQVLWGNRRLAYPLPPPAAAVWQLGLAWGSLATSTGTRLPWGDACTVDACPFVNVVWGDQCGGGDCRDTSWTTSTASGQTVVWGTDGGNPVVWAPTGETVVWGTATPEPVVWPPDDGSPPPAR